MQLPGAIFTTTPDDFCAIATQSQCAKPGTKTCTDAVDSCRAYAGDAVKQAQYFFEALNRQASQPNPDYTISPTLQNSHVYAQVNKYLDPNNFGDGQNQITCNKEPDKSAPGGGTANANKASTIPIANFRLRGKSDDLYVDRGTDLFKTTTPASLNWTGTDHDNYTAKLTATLGYQIPTDTGELIPYISAKSVLDRCYQEASRHRSQQ